MWRLHYGDGRVATLFAGRTYSIGRATPAQHNEEGVQYDGRLVLPEACSAVSRQQGYFSVGPLPADAPDAALAPDAPWLSLTYFDTSSRGATVNARVGVLKESGQTRGHVRLAHGDCLTLGFAAGAAHAEEAGMGGALEAVARAAPLCARPAPEQQALRVPPETHAAIGAALARYSAADQQPGEPVAQDLTFTLAVQWVPLRFSLTPQHAAQLPLRALGALGDTAWPRAALPAISPLPPPPAHPTPHPRLHPGCHPAPH